MKSKTAVILFNLGGPDAPEAIEPFLYNFFTDPNIIRLPAPLRRVIARSIARKRSRREAGDSYSRLGGRSPLLENTQAQALALEETLAGGDTEYRVFVSMRYWHPMADEVALAVKTFGPSHIVLLPLYPQYSTTTTRSSFQTWKRAAAAAGLEAPTSLVCCYPDSAAFIDASARLVKDVYEEARKAAAEKQLPAPRLLFSAHGLPENVIRDGDPYQWQCELTAGAIANALNLQVSDWVLCYQSRVGPRKWIGPATEDEVRRAGHDGVPLVVYPLAFVNEHVETLVEIEEEYRHLAEESGVPLFCRVPTVSADRIFIEGLAALVRKQKGTTGIFSGSEERKSCPDCYRRCCVRQFGGAEARMVT